MRYGYAQSTSALYDKVDKFFQDFVHSTYGTLIESEAHTRRDLRKFIGWVQNAMTMHQYRAQSVETCLRIAKDKW